MGERVLGWGLRLLGIALFIGPFIAAFAAHDWDIQAAVVPSQAEMDEVNDRLSGLVVEEGFSEDPLTFGDPTYSDTTIRVTVGFTSPLKIPIKITDLSASMSDQGVQVAQVQMEEAEIDVPANGTANFTLVGSYTGIPPTNPEPTDVNITFELYGVTLQLQMEAG